MKTYAIRKDDVQRAWHVIDAHNRPLGRVATQVATLLRGKHKPAYSPSLDVGDYVIVINAATIAVTGNKLDDKIYYRHSGYPGGLRQETLRHLLERSPERVMERCRHRRQCPRHASIRSYGHPSEIPRAVRPPPRPRAPPRPAPT